MQQFYLHAGLTPAEYARLTAAEAALIHFQAGVTPPIFRAAAQAVFSRSLAWLDRYRPGVVGHVPEEAASLQAFVDFFTDPLFPHEGPYWAARLSDYVDRAGEAWALAYTDAYCDLAQHYAPDTGGWPTPRLTPETEHPPETAASILPPPALPERAGSGE